MRDILARANRDVLEQLARSRALLAFDFDGTLAPITTDPDRARLRPSTRRLLEKAAQAYPCVVISGRSRADVGRRLRGMALAGLVGNHGLEHGRGPATRQREVRRWLAVLRSRLRDVRGVVIEDKGVSLAVHYRRSREKRRARARILAVAAGLGGVRRVGGKQVLNLLPAGAPHKGLALQQERARLECDTALYLGDDETDEDVFALDEPGQLLAVRVGRRKGTSAAYYVRTQAEVDRLLRVLLALRPKAPAQGKGRR